MLGKDYPVVAKLIKKLVVHKLSKSCLEAVLIHNFVLCWQILWTNKNIIHFIIL